MVATTELLFATRNAGKIRELSQLLQGCTWRGAPIRIVGLDDLPQPLPEVEETGTTFADNALLKARAAAEASGLVALADDSGLEVEALDGRPGVRSARYTGNPSLTAQRVGLAASDEDRCRWLLEELRDVEAGKRRARFRCALALVEPQALEDAVICEGVCEGEIIEAPRGRGGFGYDPLFYVEQLGCTFAEASAEQKNELSHRGRAMRQMAAYLASASSRREREGQEHDSGMQTRHALV